MQIWLLLEVKTKKVIVVFNSCDCRYDFKIICKVLTDIALISWLGTIGGKAESLFFAMKKNLAVTT